MFILTCEDLEIVCLQFYVPSNFQVELVGLADRMAKPPLGRIELYDELLKAGLRLSFHHFIIEILRSF